MKGLVITENNRLELKEISVPEITNPEQVKVKIYGTGICGSDINIVKGKIPAVKNMILGHEAIGTVVEIGENVKTLNIGDRVIVDPTQSCGKCNACKKGENCYCENFDDFQLGISLHGTFTDYYVGNEKYLYKIPESMDWKTAILVEPLCCALNSITKAKVKPTDSVLIIGCGTIGLLCQLLGKKMAKLIVGVDIDINRRNFAKKFAHHIYEPSELNLNEIFRINDGKKFDVIIDAVGNQLEMAFEFIEKGGRIVPMGLFDDYKFTIKPVDFVNYGLVLTGDVALHSAVGPALEVAKGLAELSSLITKELPLAKYEEAFDDLMGINKKSGTKQEITSIKTVLISNIE